jgi:uncharacterized protein (TIGR03118 family)
LNVDWYRFIRKSTFDNQFGRMTITAREKETIAHGSEIVAYHIILIIKQSPYMNTSSTRTFNRPIILLTSLGLAAMLGACSSSTTTTPPATITTYYAQTNLVADLPATATAAHYDPLLVNPWGIAFSTSAGAHPWLSANGSNTTVFYDTTGGSPASKTIPLPNGMPGGAPSGAVFNGSGTNFGGNSFIFSTEDGTLAGWKGADGPTATIVSDSSGSNTVYKGLAIDAASGQLYATDFHNNAIVVFDVNFKVINTFTDKTAPAGYGPFGIQNINGTLYVTYARQDYIAHDDSAGAGIGFVDRFTLAGALTGRFTSNGNLNSPWGIALAPATWGTFANAILIGNFGDGKITAYDLNGNLLGQLASSSGNIISIDGLWGISFNPSVGADPNKLYLTAGPGGESHGLFGYLYP